MPSIHLTCYDSLFNQLLQLMIIDFPLIIFYKHIHDDVYVILFREIGVFHSLAILLYGFIISILWLFYPAMILIREIIKPTARSNTNSLERSLEISIITRTIYMFLILLLAYLDPTTKILRTTPGLGIVLYGAFYHISINGNKEQERAKNG
ncbi:MAG: hypothetical protein ACTSUJ_00665 [Candidatus Njordarchaeales archaeon]